MKVRIILKAKKNFGTLKKGETMTLINEVFDAMTGIAFYPIDREQWAIISNDNFTGLKDRNGKEIYENDKLEVLYNRIGVITVKFYNGKYNICDYDLKYCELHIQAGGV